MEGDVRTAHEVNMAVEVCALGGSIEAKLPHAEASRGGVATAGGLKHIQVRRLRRPQLRPCHLYRLENHSALSRREPDAPRLCGGDNCGRFPAMYLLRKAERHWIVPKIAHVCLHDDGSVGNLRRHLNAVNRRVVAEC